MHVLVAGKYKKDRIKKQLRKGGDLVFPIISQWGLSVARETRVLIQSAIMQPFPHPSDATHKISSRLANWLQRYSSLKVWTMDDDDGWTTDHWYTISSPCEPLA